MMCCCIPHRKAYRPHHLPFSKANFSERVNTLDNINPIAGQKPVISIPKKGNAADSYNNMLNSCEISMAGEKCAILEWLSPLKPREKQAVRMGRVTGFF